MKAQERVESSRRVGVAVGLLLVAGLALLGGFLAGRRHSASVADESARQLDAAHARELADAAAAESWLAGFDRAFSLSLRRRHLDLIDAKMRVLPLPVLATASPDVAAALDEWALLRRAARDPDGAAATTAKARKLDPDPERGRLRDAIAADDGGLLRAIAATPVPEDRPAVTSVLLARGLAALDAKDVAVRVLEHAIDRRPDDFASRFALAELLFRDGPESVERARVQLTAAEALRPGSRRACTLHGFVLFDRCDEPSTAIAQLHAAQRRMPDEPVVAYVLGAALFKARHMDEARGELERALALDPSFALALAAIGDIWLDADEDARAGEFFRASLALSDTADARDGLGGALFQSGRIDEACAWFEESVRKQPDDALLRDHLSSVLVRRGRHAEAIAQLKEAVRLDEWIAEVQNDYAWELVNSGDPALWRPGQALKHTQRACELEPGNAWYRNTLGVALYRLGEYDQSVIELESVCDLPRGGGPYDLLFLAMAKERLGDHADALALFARGSALIDEKEQKNDELGRLRIEAEAVVRTGKPEGDGS